MVDYGLAIRLPDRWARVSASQARNVFPNSTSDCKPPGQSMHGAPADIRTAGGFQNEISPSVFGFLDIDTPHSRPINSAEVNLTLGRLLITGHPLHLITSCK
jgi:hypothetical protein